MAFQLCVYTGSVTVAQHHLSELVFSIRMLPSFKSWSNHNGERADTQNIGGATQNSIPGTGGCPSKAVTEGAKYTLSSDEPARGSKPELLPSSPSWKPQPQRALFQTEDETAADIFMLHMMKCFIPSPDISREKKHYFLSEKISRTLTRTYSPFT